MFIFIKHQKEKFLYATITRTMVFVLSLALVFAPSAGYAQVINLPAPGTMVFTSPAFNPAIVSGITIYPDDPLQFDFIIDIGDDQLQGEALKKESQKLINYFMATLTVPEDEMWVNLSPYEKDRIIADGLSHTEMGRDMLAQDYLLKQLTASLMYPEDEFGKKFWDRVHAKAQAQYGTTEIPMNTFNKIWIVPDEAVVYVNDTNVFVVENHLKVMLEEDYLAMDFHQKSTARSRDPSRDVAMNSNVGAGLKPARTDQDLSVSREIIREIIIPEIEREVNEGKNFANLRQIYNSMLLATWYKKKLIGTAPASPDLSSGRQGGRERSLLGQAYVNQNKIDGIELEDKTAKQAIYDQYVEAFEKGVYNYIKEDIDAVTKKMIPRKYFSGGLRGIRTTGVSEMRSVSSPLREMAQRTHVIAAMSGEPLGKAEASKETCLEFGFSKIKVSRLFIDPSKLNRKTHPASINSLGKLPRNLIAFSMPSPSSCIWIIKCPPSSSQSSISYNFGIKSLT